MIPGIAFEGQVYRALNPLWAADPLSGEGARLYGGRFNARGTPALYTSLTALGALREAQQVGTFQPITLVAYRAHVTAVFDATDPASLAAAGVDSATIADPGWREAMRAHGVAPTQTLAARLLAAGFRALLVPSFAPGVSAADRNLVVLRWNLDPDAALTVIDDEGRLRVTGSSAPPAR